MDAVISVELGETLLQPLLFTTERVLIDSFLKARTEYGLKGRSWSNWIALGEGERRVPRIPKKVSAFSVEHGEPFRQRVYGGLKAFQHEPLRPR
jgi:hypothetical protein